MIIVVAGLLAVLTVPLTGGDLRRLGALPVRHAWAIWLTVAVQTGLLWLPDGFPEWLAEGLHIGSYVAAAWFAWANRRLPGVPLMTLGGALNLVAIVANGGVMPASASAWRRAGFEPPDDEGFSNSTVVDDARLAFLGDVFAVPEGWPFANVFSVGDVVIVIGIGWLAHAWCRREPAPEGTSRRAPSADGGVGTVVADLPQHEPVRRRDRPGR